MVPVFVVSEGKDLTPGTETQSRSLRALCILLLKVKVTEKASDIYITRG